MKNTTYTLVKGTTGLLISMPHNGTDIPEDIKAKMTDVGLSVQDTDWYMDRLYDFALALGASVLVPRYNRYVIDLNRDPEGVNLYPGADTTELCPTTSFESAPLYQAGQEPDEQESQRRVRLYWQPYHQAIRSTLDELQQTHGKAVLLEAHSIASIVPRFFDGQLPDFNFGNNSGQSCSDVLLNAVNEIDYYPYSKVVNGRFKGGYITRHYANLERNIHTLQLELSQRTYLHEPSNQYHTENANAVKIKLTNLVKTMLSFASQPSLNC